MLNWYILVYLLVNVLSMLTMLYITWTQFRETKRPKDEYTKLRVYLLVSPSLIFLGLLLGIPRLIQSLNLVTDVGQNIRIIGGIIVIGGFSLSKFLIYTYRVKSTKE